MMLVCLVEYSDFVCSKVIPGTVYQLDSPLAVIETLVQLNLRQLCIQYTLRTRIWMCTLLRTHLNITTVKYKC